jgi:hypothetical protein
MPIPRLDLQQQNAHGWHRKTAHRVATDNSMTRLASYLLNPGRWGAVVVLTFCVGCSARTTTTTGVGPKRGEALTAAEAAQLAANLANDECDRRYNRRPFAPDQRSIVWDGERYRWGGLDVGGPGGFSALVTFAKDGSESKVEVYYSTDIMQR